MSETPEMVMEMEDWRGYSAYEIAVQNGFEGNQAQWLASLKGDKGDPGDSRFTADDKSYLASLQEAVSVTSSGIDLGGMTVEAVATEADDKPCVTAREVDGRLHLGFVLPRGRTGETGPQGVSGVYVGSEEMPEGYNVQIDPGGMASLTAYDVAAYRLAVLYLTGDISAMTKEAEAALAYVYGERSGTCTLKWQGSSSLAYPKKNHTIKFDAGFEAKSGWGAHKKYCLKVASR